MVGLLPGSGRGAGYLSVSSQFEDEEVLRLSGLTLQLLVGVTALYVASSFTGWALYFAYWGPVDLGIVIGLAITVAIIGLSCYACHMGVRGIRTRNAMTRCCCCCPVPYLMGFQICLAILCVLNLLGLLSAGVGALLDPRYAIVHAHSLVENITFLGGYGALFYLNHRLIVAVSGLEPAQPPAGEVQLPPVVGVVVGAPVEAMPALAVESEPARKV